MNKYRTSPWPTVHTPPGIPFIIGNEGAERLSFYGMRAIPTWLQVSIDDLFLSNC